MTRYDTEEDRLLARRRSRRKYYEAHKEQEQARARTRWHKSKAKGKKTLPARRTPCAQEALLPATSAYLGSELIVHNTTIMGPLLETLETDAAGWNEGLCDKTVWSRFTERLIQQERRATHSARLQKSINTKIQHSKFLEHVAQQGADLAWDHGGPESSLYQQFDELIGQAKRLTSGMEELLELAELGGGRLLSWRDGRSLIWQCT